MLVSKKGVRVKTLENAVILIKLQRTPNNYFTHSVLYTVRRTTSKQSLFTSSIRYRSKEWIQIYKNGPFGKKNYEFTLVDVYGQHP